MSHTFDATLKGILGEAAADLRKPFRLPALEPVRALNVDLSTISAATDIAFGFGDPLQEIADLNFQSGPDPHLDARLLLYNAAFHLRFRVPVRSVLVLLRPKAETAGLSGKLTYTSGGNTVSFEYDVIRMWKEAVQPFLEGGLSLLPLATLCKMPTGKPLEKALRDVVREIDRRLAAAPNYAEAVRIMTGAHKLAALRIPSRQQVDALFEGVQVMHETAAWDEVFEEGLLKGQIELLLEQGRQLFGDPDGRTEAALTGIQDVKRLKRMGLAILNLKSWKALLAVK